MAPVTPGIVYTILHDAFLSHAIHALVNLENVNLTIYPSQHASLGR